MALSIFEKADPDLQKQKDAEAALRTRRRDRDALNEKLGIAEAAIANYRAKARQLAADGGDDAAISKLEVQMRASQDRRETLIGAVADIDKIIVGLEAQIAAIIDQRMRTATSTTVATMANQGAQVSAAFDTAAAALETWARESGLIVPEANGVTAFTANLRAQLKPAIEMIITGLHGHCRSVLAGTAPASLPRLAPAAPKLAVVPAAPTTQAVFMMKASRYRDQHRGQVALGAHRVAELPLPIAERALEIGAAIPITDPRRRTLQGQSGMIDPELSRCLALDDSELAEPKKSGAPPIASSSPMFQPLDRGEPYSVTVPTTPFVEPERRAGTRSMPPEGEQ